MSTLRRVLPIALVAGLAMTASSGAQTVPSAGSTATAGAGQATVRSSGDARKDNIRRMSKRVSLEVTEARLEDVMTYIREITQADLEIFWQGDSDSVPGLDKEKKITVSIKNRPALAVLEAVLDKAKSEFGSGNTWQMTAYGPIQIGPREALNRERRVEMYDINDLLTVIPRYAEVPEIDLNSVLQQSQGGGGGTSPFEEADEEEEEARPRSERAREIIDILITTVESEQWTDNGGEAATIRFYGSTLIVNAPDYVHRQINGYPYWPSHSVTKSANGRRWLTLNADTGTAKIDGFAPSEVTAIVNGRPISSGGGGGGGGGLKAPPAGGGGGGSKDGDGKK
jgi:hypothetical protein